MSIDGIHCGFSGADDGWHVYMDGESVFFTKDKYQRDMFMAELKAKLKAININFKLAEQNQRLVEALEKARDKSQILASHCAVQLDRGGNVGSAYAFEKSQEIYELLRDKLLEKKD